MIGRDVCRLVLTAWQSWFSSGDPFKNVIPAPGSQLLRGLLLSQCALLQNPSSSLRLAFSAVLVVSKGPFCCLLSLCDSVCLQGSSSDLLLPSSGSDLQQPACYLFPPGRAVGPSHARCPAEACSLGSHSVTYLLIHLVILERNHWVFLMLMLSFSSGL